MRRRPRKPRGCSVMANLRDELTSQLGCAEDATNCLRAAAAGGCGCLMGLIVFFLLILGILSFA